MSDAGQVRSLGVLAAKVNVASPSERLDLFTLDFGGDWSALHGSIVWSQVVFTG